MIIASVLAVLIGGGTAEVSTFVLFLIGVGALLIIGFTVGMLAIMLSQNIDHSPRRRKKKKNQEEY